MGRQHKYIIADPKPPTDSTDVDLKLKDVEEGEVEKKRYMCGGFFGFSCLAIVAFIIGAILVAGISAIATLGALGYLDMMKGTIRPKPTYTAKTETPTVTSVYNVTTQSPNVTITTTELPTKTELTTELPVITSSLSPVTTSHSTTPKITTAMPTTSPEVMTSTKVHRTFAAASTTPTTRTDSNIIETSSSTIPFRESTIYETSSERLSTAVSLTTQMPATVHPTTTMGTTTEGLSTAVSLTTQMPATVHPTTIMDTITTTSHVAPTTEIAQTTISNNSTFYETTETGERTLTPTGKYESTLASLYPETSPHRTFAATSTIPTTRTDTPTDSNIIKTTSPSSSATYSPVTTGRLTTAIPLTTEIPTTTVVQPTVIPTTTMHTITTTSHATPITEKAQTTISSDTTNKSTIYETTETSESTLTPSVSTLAYLTSSSYPETSPQGTSTPTSTVTIESETIAKTSSATKLTTETQSTIVPTGVEHTVTTAPTVATRDYTNILTTMPPTSMPVLSTTPATTPTDVITTPMVRTTIPTTQMNTLVATITPSAVGSTLRTTIPSLGYNYSEVLHKSILFYEAERSGELPPDNRIPYRRDSAMEDQGLNGEDLTGGWYDAGDHLKSTFSTAYAVSTLTWGFLAFPDGYREAGEYDRFLDSIKWPLDWLLKAHTIPGEELYVQVGLPSADHRYWGRPEEMTMDRPAYKIDAENPGSDVAGQTAAAMAAGYLAFRDSDPDYADTLLNNSRLLYTFASTYRGRYSDVLDTVIYTSGAYGDELAWAAVWLHLATGEQSYLDDAVEFYEEFELWKNPRTFSWNVKTAGVQLLLYNITNDGQYSSKFKKCMNMWLPGGGINRVFNGQLAVYLDWGSLRYTSTMAFLALVAADIGIRPTAYRDFAISQINFMLGDGGRSYVVGFGENPPQRVHHRAASCPDMPTSCRWNYFGSSEPNPQILYGALAGGPNKAGVYQDSRSSYETNEVAIDYNAGFQSAIAGMLNLQVIGVDTST